MQEMTKMPLSNRLVALAESRQLDVLAAMLQRQGADVLRCPMVSILDSPDSESVTRWLQRCIDQPFDYLVLLTGEGLRRLLGFADRAGLRAAFITSLSKTQLICRGPKPVQALREVGLTPQWVAEQPTTDGVIATLDKLELTEQRVAVQLYGDNPNEKLITFLQEKNAAVDSVAPYRYASDSDDNQVQDLINKLVEGVVDVIVFTSQPQLKRLLKVAKDSDYYEQLLSALNEIVVAAVGPVVAAALENHNITVDVMPEDKFFMKPMTAILAKKFS